MILFNHAFVFDAGTFCNIGMLLAPLLQVSAETSQVYPSGQQCSPSLQQTAFGKGQQPHCPDESLQHVLPSGHSDWPSGQTTLTSLFPFNAGIFCNIDMSLLPLLHVPSETSQVYPFGQQCTPSLQQTAFGKGQQPHCPEESLQQVLSSGHSDWPSGQTMLTWPFLCNAGIFSNIGMSLLPLLHVPAETSQVYPFGQQCTPSLQQTAFGKGQQPHCPEESLQHVLPSGHSDWPSGQTTLLRLPLPIAADKVTSNDTLSASFLHVPF